jgi:uncharacterized protein affecting Mg2+/Co2+ transport
MPYSEGMQPWAQLVNEDWWLGDQTQVVKRLETEGALLAPPVLGPLDKESYLSYRELDLAEDILRSCLEIKADTVGTLFALAIANWISACDCPAWEITLLHESVVESVVSHLPIDVLGSAIHKLRDWKVKIVPLNPVGNRFITMCRIAQTCFGKV